MIASACWRVTIGIATTISGCYCKLNSLISSIFYSNIHAFAVASAKAHVNDNPRLIEIVVIDCFCGVVHCIHDGAVVCSAAIAVEYLK